MRPDTRSLLHGIFNLILPFFAYDLAGLLVFSLTVGDYSPWLSVWPMRILTYLPFLSDLIGVIVGGMRYARRGRTRALLGIIFSVGGAARRCTICSASIWALPCLGCWSDFLR